MIGDMGQHVAQVGLRINAVQPGAADERLHGRSALATAVGPHEQEAHASQAASSQRILGNVVVDLNCPIHAVIRQGLPLAEPVVGRPGRVRLVRQRQRVNAARDFLKSAEVKFPTLGNGRSALQ